MQPWWVWTVLLKLTAIIIYFSKAVKKFWVKKNLDQWGLGFCLFYEKTFLVGWEKFNTEFWFSEGERKKHWGLPLFFFWNKDALPEPSGGPAPGLCPSPCLRGGRSWQPPAGLEARAAPEGLPAPCGGAAGEGAGLGAAAGTWVDGCSVCFRDALAPIIIPALINGAGKRWALLQTKTCLLCVGGEHVTASPKATRVPILQAGEGGPSTPPRWLRAGGGGAGHASGARPTGGRCCGHACSRRWQPGETSLEVPGGCGARPTLPADVPSVIAHQFETEVPRIHRRWAASPFWRLTRKFRGRPARLKQALPVPWARACSCQDSSDGQGCLRLFPVAPCFGTGQGLRVHPVAEGPPAPGGGGQWWQRPKCGVSLPPHQSPRGICPCGSGLLFLAFYQFEIFYFPLFGRT